LPHPMLRAYPTHRSSALDPSLGEATRTLLASQGFGGESYAQSDPQNSTVIYHAPGEQAGVDALRTALGVDFAAQADPQLAPGTLDRKSTRLNSSHVQSSY